MRKINRRNYAEGSLVLLAAALLLLPPAACSQHFYRRLHRQHRCVRSPAQTVQRLTMS